MSEVTIVGAGPAGLAAAVAAGQSGATVRLVDSNPAPGGQIWRRDGRRGNASAAQPYLDALQSLAAAGRLESLDRTTIVDANPTRLLALREADDLRTTDGAATELDTTKLVLATGARERFLPFPGWTLPGVMGVGGIQALCKQGFDVRGQRIVIAGSGPLLLAVGAHLKTAGAEVVLVAEQAPFGPILKFGAGLWRQPSKLRQLAGLSRSLRGVRRAYDAWPTAARPDANGRVHEVVMSIRGREEIIECDLLATGFGLVPDVGLAQLLGCAVEHGSVVTDPLQRTSVDGVWCAGELTGIGGVDAALSEGSIAGHAAAGDEHAARALIRQRDRQRKFAHRLESTFALRHELMHLPDDDTIVCRCEDVRFGAVRARVDLRDAKLETRCGMGPCQGRVCAPALEFCLGFAPPPPRPPLFPVPLRALISRRS